MSSNVYLVANIQLHLFLLLSKVIGGFLVMTLNARESWSSWKIQNLYHRGLLPPLKGMELALHFHSYAKIGFRRFFQTFLTFSTLTLFCSCSLCTCVLSSSRRSALSPLLGYLCHWEILFLRPTIMCLSTRFSQSRGVCIVVPITAVWNKRLE